ncbi:MAG: glycerol-3-phosphate acyltransferase [Chloroflexi bacterium]|nr:glycerol-3-phosphate acyltransferase [Chloroflexota bacterium]
MIPYLLAGLLGYVLGAIPTGAVFVRLLQGKDIRRYGSGHTGGTNVGRLAGFWPGALTALVDAVLGAVAVWLAGSLFRDPWAAAVSGVAAIIGHNWSVFIALGGGIGLSTLTGAVVAGDPASGLTALALIGATWLVLVLLVKAHRARATVYVMLGAGVALLVAGAPVQVLALGIAGGLVVVVKTLPDWHREYSNTRGATKLEERSDAT